MNACVHLLILSIVAFFHFLLNHRMADIQDWVFFHGWEILTIGKLLSLFLVSRFIGILSSERRPFLHLYHFKKGILKKDLFISLVIFLLGVVIVGKPVAAVNFDLNFYRLSVSLIGPLVFYGSEVLVLLSLNEYLPLKKKQWHVQVILFSLITYLSHRALFLYGERWEGDVVFFFIFIFYTLRLRGSFGWIHPFCSIVFLILPLSAFFGLDPIWGSRFSPFVFVNKVTGLEIGVFTLVSFFYFRRKAFGIKS